jgi:hypothetical protein
MTAPYICYSKDIKSDGSRWCGTDWVRLHVAWGFGTRSPTMTISREVGISRRVTRAENSIGWRRHSSCGLPDGTSSRSFQAKPTRFRLPAGGR